MYKSLIIYSCVILAGIFYGNTQKSLDQLLKRYNTNEIPYITVEQLQEVRNDAVLLDSREKEEYDISHIPKAISIGYDHFALDSVTQKNFPKDATIIVYCSLGIRSEVIAKKLKEQGYTNVKNLYGGIFEWKNKHHKVVDSLNEATNNVHIFSKPWGKWLKEGNKYTSASKRIK